MSVERSWERYILKIKYGFWGNHSSMLRRGCGYIFHSFLVDVGSLQILLVVRLLLQRLLPQFPEGSHITWFLWSVSSTEFFLMCNYHKLILNKNIRNLKWFYQRLSMLHANFIWALVVGTKHKHFDMHVIAQ